MPDIYLSVDIEADGPIPGVYSMLSLGAAAFVLTPGESKPYRMLDSIQVNLKPLPGAIQEERTMREFWDKQPEAWKASTEGAVDAEVGMQTFRTWLDGLCQANQGRPIFVSYPVTFDFMFAYWYVVKFTGFPAPFGFQGLDIKTLAAERMGVPYKDAIKKNMPRHWFKGAPRHSHKAVEDAIGQGILLMNILLEDKKS